MTKNKSQKVPINTNPLKDVKFGGPESIVPIFGNGWVGTIKLTPKETTP